MPDDIDDSSTETEASESEDRTVTLRRSDIRALEKRAKRAEEAEARAAAAERKLAFASAGIALDDPRTGYFVRGYEGEVTSEAIRKAAEEAGFLTPAKAPEPTVGAAEAAGLSAIEAATASGTPPPGSHLAGLEQAMRTGGVPGMVAYMESHGIPVTSVQ